MARGHTKPLRRLSTGYVYSDVVRFGLSGWSYDVHCQHPLTSGLWSLEHRVKATFEFLLPMCRIGKENRLWNQKSKTSSVLPDSLSSTFAVHMRLGSMVGLMSFIVPSKSGFHL